MNTERLTRSDLSISAELVQFIEDEALNGTGVAPETFWTALSELAHDFGPRNRALLEKRDEIQAAINEWHIARRGQAHDATAYKAFLSEIGYLLPEGDDFQITTSNVDPKSPASQVRSLLCLAPMRVLS